VFRAGFARTIPSARQLVNHGHVSVTQARGHRLVPHLQGRCGDVRDRKKVTQIVEQAFPIADSFQTPWIEVDRTNRKATISALPDEGAVLFPLRVQLVVEFYSQKM